MTTQKQLNKELLQELKEVKSELLRYKQDFEKEKNIKNGLYFFILTNDLVALLQEFRKTNDYYDTDYQVKALDFLIDTLP
ncbi:hypothetical protein [Kordia jejudonensis]|uniref:hypothetical protein n=1 Tax=Kordia jejudonensis TaxID=1348245 RepID=UPI000629AD5A|nr:hypothetical protein [Kordia jejudonensis]